MNEIVKIHNDLTNEKLGKMNAKELDLFMTICHKMRDKGTCEVTISFDELRTLGHYNKNSNKELKNELLRANEKLLEFKILIEQGAKTKQRTLFKEFVTDMDALTVTCEVWEELVYILTGVVKNFTRFELDEFVSLESKYAKRLYKLLKQYRTQGTYYTTKENFYKDLDVPKSYKNSDFNERVLHPAIRECKKYIPSLKCVPKKGGRGGAVLGYEFTFDREFPPEQPKKKTKNKFNEFEQQQLDINELEKQILSN